MHADGRTILLTTHYLEEAEALCEEIAILNRGRVVAQESKQQLLQRNPYRTLRLTLAQTDYTLPENLQALVLERQDNTLALRLHKTEHQIGDVIRALQLVGIDVTDLGTEEAGLEEVFLGLTGKQDPAAEERV